MESRDKNAVIDRVPPSVRSRMMAAVGSKNTKLELAVRQALFRAGYRYRLHRRDLPGCPDLVLVSQRVAIFVHGCFWHGHDCPRGRPPTSNIEFWSEKLGRNKTRDARAGVQLAAAGWKVETIWECSIDAGIDRLLKGLRADVRSGVR